jgi:hypothetical protein
MYQDWLLQVVLGDRLHVHQLPQIANPISVRVEFRTVAAPMAMVVRFVYFAICFPKLGLTLALNRILTQRDIRTQLRKFNRVMPTDCHLLQ